MEENNLLQLITSPTRAGVHRDTLLDHIYSRMAHVYQFGCIDIGLSDHKMIYVIKKKQYSKHKKTVYKGRNVRNFAKEDLHSMLTTHNWGRF